MKLWDAITSANEQGRLGLLLYTIPNFPDPDVFRATTRTLEQLPWVSVIETTYPVGSNFSSHANELIRHAHRVATSQNAPLPPRASKPSLCVLYRETHDRLGFEGFVEATKGAFEALLLEWDEPDESSYIDIAARYGVEVVQCIGPWMTTERIHTLMHRARADGTVYLMSAPMTGGDLFGDEVLARCIATAREVRPDVRIAAGFGISSAEHIQRLVGVTGLDAVIIGSAFLRTMERGHAEVLRYLDQIGPALVRSRDRSS